MIKCFPGVTHAIVTVPLKTESEVTKVYAYVDLHFGPGDDNSISGIRYVKIDGRYSWESPMYARMKDGKRTHHPIFRGEVLKEVSKLASAAAAKVKRHYGKPVFGTRYRVLENDVLIDDLKDHKSH